MNRSFTPAWWLRGPHVQTLWGKFFLRGPLHETQLERLDTPDGDFLDIHHLEGPDNAPLLILLHGLEGSVRSHYIQGLFTEARQRGWRAAAMIFRSCGDEPNRARRSYHSGETTDLAFLINHLEIRFPRSPLLLAGVSLGGNVLLKYLGEQAGDASARIKAAAAVSVPFDLACSSRYIDRGFSKVYQQSFLRSLNAKAQIKLGQFPDLASRNSLGKASTMFEFDDRFTAPVHGFRDAMDYYGQSSSIKWIERISTKTLLLSAVDDPFLPPQVLDEVRDIASRNPNLELDFPRHGGHVGFISGRNPFNPVYYLEQRVGDFLARTLEASVTP